MPKLHFILNSGLHRLLRWLPPRMGLKCLVMLYEAQGAVESDNVCLPRCMNRRRIAVDIGANNGVTAVIFSRHFRQVYAFEANPDLAARVHPGLPSNVFLHALALSDDTGAAELRIPVSCGVVLEGWASLERPGVGDVSSWKKVCVARRALDSFNLIDVDLIKIDVEGHEMAVLVGARETILRNRPWMIIEVWDESRPAVTSLMRELGYHTASLRDLCGVEGAPNNLIFLPDGTSS